MPREGGGAPVEKGESVSLALDESASTLFQQAFQFTTSQS